MFHHQLMASSGNTENEDTMSSSPESTGLTECCVPHPLNRGMLKGGRSYPCSQLISMFLSLMWIASVTLHQSLHGSMSTTSIWSQSTVWPVLRLWVLRADFPLPFNTKVLCSENKDMTCHSSTCPCWERRGHSTQLDLYSLVMRTLCPHSQHSPRKPSVDGETLEGNQTFKLVY